jgi:bifunctional DNase/RNase
VPLVLKEKHGTRQLILELSPIEARVIAREQGQRITGEQPQVYDLWRDVIRELGGRVDHVILADAGPGAVTARVVIVLDGEARTLRASPGDAVTLAVKTGADIFVEASVLEKFGVAP